MKGGYINEKLSFSAAGQVRAAEGNPYNVYKRLMGLSTGTAPGGGGGGSTHGRSAASAAQERQRSGPRRAERARGAVRPQQRGQGAPRSALHRHPRHGKHHDGHGHAVLGDGLDVTAIKAMNTGSAFSQNGKVEDVAKLQMELVAFAFSCNATRVATLQIGDGTDETNYTIDGQSRERFHWISHRQCRATAAAAARDPERGRDPRQDRPHAHGDVQVPARQVVDVRSTATARCSTTPSSCGPAMSPTGRRTASTTCRSSSRAARAAT